MVEGFILKLIFLAAAHSHNIDPTVLEGICRYETDSGRVLVHHNRNGSWDVGYCQNHRPPSSRRPPIPNQIDSIFEAAGELAYWKRQHRRFCVHMLNKRGTCGKVIYGKWRGITSCRRDHKWFSHYNWGFRVLRNGYDRGVKCFIKKGFEKCRQRVSSRN